MSRYALIRNNKVCNIIVCDVDKIQNFLNQYDYVVSIDNTTFVNVGFNYDNVSGTFSDPGIELVTNNLCTVLQFRSKFTQQEKENIYTAAKTFIAIQVWLDDLSCVKNDTVDLKDARTIFGVHTLESMGIIEAGRANQILGQ